MRFEVTPHHRGGWEWTLRSANHKTLARSADVFECHLHASRAAEEFATGAERLQVRVVRNRNGQWRWSAYAGDSAVAVSEAVFYKRAAALEAGARARDSAHHAGVRAATSTSA